MSLETFKEEFYPVDASQGDIMSELEATEACLLKWTGLLPENLKKHGVVINGYGDLTEDQCSNERFWMDGSSCHLCMLSESKLRSEYGSMCNHCPIKRIHKESCCVIFRDYKTQSKDPSEMIELLTKTRDALIKEQQQKQQEQEQQEQH